MPIIRQQQIQAFIAPDETELARVIHNAVRAANKERVRDIGDAMLYKMIEIGIDRARSHDIATAEDIARFIAIMFEIAPRFDEQADIRKVLENEDLPPAIRLDQLFTCVDDAAWAEAAQNYEDDFWFRGDS